jgi:hypothetical protein
MPTSSVLALVSTPNQAEQAIDLLRQAGFLANEISFLYSDAEGELTLFHENSTKAPEGATIGGSSGGILGGVTGFLIGMGVLVIPGAGPFIAAGPIMAALSGAAVGAAAGGLGGYLLGLGVPEYEAKVYSGKLDEGNMLIVVHCDTSKVDLARSTLEQAKAHAISTATPLANP